MLGLVDSYRIYNKTKKASTFFRIETNKEAKSRVDYILAPTDKHEWYSPKI